MDNEFIGVILTFVGGLILGLVVGFNAGEGSVNSHCEKYGKHVTEQYVLICDKSK